MSANPGLRQRRQTEDFSEDFSVLCCVVDTLEIDAYTLALTQPFGGLRNKASAALRGTIMRRLWLPVLAAILTAGFTHTSTGASLTVSQETPTVTLTGKVVDAACYMIHPPAASIPSHDDCAAACLARGVPLAIANEKDSSLYFPASGDPRLSPLLDQRVRVTGSVTRKSEPMELTMNVGPANQMSVRVDGGYNVVIMQTVEKLPATSRK